MDSVSQFTVEKVLDGLLEVAEIIYSSKSEGEELKEKLLQLKHVIDENMNLISHSDLSSDILKNLYEGFRAELEKGLVLVGELENISSFNISARSRLGNRVLECRNKIMESIHIQGSPYVINTVLNLTAIVRDNERQRSDDVEKLKANFRNLERLMLENVRMDEPADRQLSINSTLQVPPLRVSVVGLNIASDAVRKILLQDDFDIVGITGMGGHGKTTLATYLCNDAKVKEHFDDRIFITVSQLDGDGKDLLNILGTMWDKIVGGSRPSFRNTEAAHSQLQQAIEQRTNRRTLVILDDVWSKSNAEILSFKAGGYKTVITSRDDSTIPEKKGSYLHKMDILGEADALSLFCFWAFDGQRSIPKTEREDLVQQVAAKCHGLPLALKVIGSCLRGQPRPVWESAKADLSTGEYRNDYHEEFLLNQLEKSIKNLDEELKKCFLDLGAFPLGGKFSVDSLLDIWVYVRGMKWESAFVVLLDLASRNLLDLKGDSRSGPAPITYHCASELSFSQHDVLRDLALRLARRDSERLFMPCRDHGIPQKWQTPGDQPSCARFLSIHTDAMEEQDWCQINFCEVEALGLFFASTSSKYCLPTFLHTMPKLKVLIIYNYGSQRAVLSGLPSFPSLVQIRSVLLHKLIVPPLYENCKLEKLYEDCKLEKLYVCLCEGLGSIPLVDKEPEALNFPNIIEINLDHCSDLEKLPVKLCNLTSLQRLSITNCHLVPELPDDLGSLSSLKVLRLSACPSLKEIPPSICKLRQLEYLDISVCRGLHNLPPGFAQLSKLETLDMRDCSLFNNLPTFKLRSLKHLIIPDNANVAKRGEWLSAIPNLTIHAVPEVFTLDWLSADGTFGS